jgi:hypothetical protein
MTCVHECTHLRQLAIRAARSTQDASDRLCIAALLHLLSGALHSAVV